MKTVNKTFVYRTFAEMIEYFGVNHPVTEKARQTLQEMATDGEWYDAVYDVWKDRLAEIGFENAEISFRGFASQGDGASFIADVDAAKLAKYLSGGETEDPVQAEFQPDADHRYAWLTSIDVDNYVTIKIVRSSGSGSYVHYNTIEAEHTCYTGDLVGVEAILDELAQDAESLAKRLSKRIYVDLEGDYFAQQEDDCLTDLSECNEYLFDEDGNIE